MLVLHFPEAKDGVPGDFAAFYDAATAMRTDPSRVYLGAAAAYIYPPLLAWLFQPLTFLDGLNAARVWAVVSWLLIPVCAWLCASAIDERQGRRIEPGSSGRWRPALDVWALAGLGVLIVGEKLLSEISYVNTNMLVILSFALGMKWLDRRPILAGIVLGLGANIKYLPLVVLPWALARGRFGVVGGVVIGFGLGAALPATTVGIDQTVAHWDAALGGLTGIDEAGQEAGDARISDITWRLSVSLTSFAHRLGGVLVEGEAARKAGWAITALLAAGVFAFGWLVYRASGVSLWVAERARRGSVVELLEYCGLIVAVLVFSPQAAGRHFNMMLPVVVVGVAVANAMPAGWARRWVVVSLVGFGCSLFLPPADLSEGALEAWRWVGGIGWCALAMYFVVLRAGLVAGRRVDVSS